MRTSPDYDSTPFEAPKGPPQKPQKYLPMPVKAERDDIKMQKIVGSNRDDLRRIFQLKKFDKEQGLDPSQLKKLIGP